MGKPSTIDLLPEDILEKLHELLRDPRVTQLEATARINEILEATGHGKVSKSSVNRYAVKMEKVGEKLRQSREVAKMWIGKIGAAPQGELGHFLNEFLRTVVFEFCMKVEDMELTEENLPGISKLTKDMSLTLQRLEASATLNVKREAEIRKQALEQAADAVENEVKKAGLSSDTVEEIKRQILGINA